MFPYTCTPTSLNVLYGGRMRTLNSTHPGFKRAVDLVKAIAATGPAQVLVDELESLLDIRKFIARITFGRVQVGDNEVRIDGTVAHSYVTQRLLEMVRADFDVMPMMRFIDKLLLNPTADVREDMWKWLEAGGMPLCEDGDFIAFKKVKSDFFDYHTGTVFHGVGTPVSMPREECDDDRNSTCSRGLHFCSYSYLDGYHGREGHVLILKINPKDVVAIPRDYKLSKGRACAYFVQDTVPEDEAAKFFDGKPVVTYDSEGPTTPDPFGLVSVLNRGELVTSIERAKAGKPFSAAICLENAFRWETTPQGQQHWIDIAYDQIKPTPTDIAWLEGLLAYTDRKDAEEKAAADVKFLGEALDNPDTVFTATEPEYDDEDEDYSSCDCDVCNPLPESQQITVDIETTDGGGEFILTGTWAKVDLAVPPPESPTGDEDAPVIKLEWTSDLIVAHGDNAARIFGADNGYEHVRPIDGAVALQAYLNTGNADDLIRAFSWRSSPQGWEHWRAVARGHVVLSDADREWLQGLLKYWKPHPDWVEAMRRG